MAEGGEGLPIQLKDKDKAKLQKVAATVAVGEHARGRLTDNVDQDRYARARQHIEIGEFNASMKDLEGDGRTAGVHVRGMVERFGIRKDDGTKDRPASADSAYQRSLKALQDLAPMLQAEKFDNLRDDEKTALAKSLTRQFSKNPQFAELDDATIEAYAKDCLQNPQLRGKIIERTKAIQGIDLISEEEIRAAEKAVKEAEARKTESSKQITRLEKVVGRAEKKVTPVDDGDESLEHPATKAIKDRLDDVKTEREDVKDKYERITERLLEIQNMPDADKKQKMIQDEFRSLLAKQNTSANRLEELRTAERQLDRQLSSLTVEEHPTADTDERDERNEAKLEEHEMKASEARITAEGLDSDIAAAKAHLEDLKEKRSHQEEEIAGALEGVFPNAALDFVHQRIEEAFKSLEAKEPEVQAEALKPIKKELDRLLESRWTRTVTRKRGIFRKSRPERMKNTQSINHDFDTFLSDGEEKLTLNIMNSLSLGGLTGPEKAARIKEFMESDTFKNDYSPLIIQRVIAERALIKPSGFTPGEIDQMLSMKNVRDQVQSALDSNAEFRKTITTYGESGDMDLDQQDFRSQFSRIAARHPGLLLGGLNVPLLLWDMIRAAWRSSKTNAREAISQQMTA